MQNILILCACAVLKTHSVKLFQLSSMKQEAWKKCLSKIMFSYVVEDLPQNMSLNAMCRKSGVIILVKLTFISMLRIC